MTGPVVASTKEFNCWSPLGSLTLQQLLCSGWTSCHQKYCVLLCLIAWFLSDACCRYTFFFIWSTHFFSTSACFHISGSLMVLIFSELCYEKNCWHDLMRLQDIYVCTGTWYHLSLMVFHRFIYFLLFFLFIIDTSVYSDRLYHPELALITKHDGPQPRWDSLMGVCP